MTRSVTGWAVTVDDEIIVSTVSKYRRGAIMVWLRANDIKVTEQNSVYLVEESFKLLKIPKHAEVIPVTVSAPVRSVT